MEKKTVRSKCQCGATVTVSVLAGAASTVATCPQCGTGYELVVRPCPSCNTTRYIVARPGGRTGDPRCQRCVERAQIAAEAHQRERERLAAEAEAQRLNAAVPANVIEPKPKITPVGAARLAALALVFGGFVVWPCFRSFNRAKQTQAQVPDTKIGETGLLYVDTGTNSIPVARTEAALSELTDCINHKDKEGFAKMALDGKVMFIDANTPVRLIGLGGLFYSCRRIRILSGEFYAEEGWVPYEWVR